MLVRELIKRLSAMDPELEVMVLDSFNGGGQPRTINLGPTYGVITQEISDECCDCEDRVGESVVVMGWGCY
jgi:hypothetical protein